MRFSYFLSTALGLLLATSIPAQESGDEPQGKSQRNEPPGWQISVGVGALYAPNFLGDDEGQLRIFPNVTVRYQESFFASVNEGIGYNLVNTDSWRVGPIVKYSFDRDEDGDSAFGLGDDTTDLQGLGDVDGTVEAGAFAEYSLRGFQASLEVRQGVGGHEGLVAELGLRYRGKVARRGPPILYSLGPEVTWADESFHSAYFDVNDEQAAASGLAVFDAGAGIRSYGLKGSLIVPFRNRLSLVTLVSFDRLVGDVADSSLVRERGSENQAFAGVVLGYTF